MMRLLALCAILCPLLVGCSGDSEDAAPPTEPPAWNHDPGDADLGPDAWGELDESFEQCSSGEAQSPVDIADTAIAALPDLEFDYPDTQLTVTNTGHTIEVSVPESSNLTLTIDGAEYRLVQFHFHAPSEHTLDGRSYDAEVHFVHESVEGEIAVLAALYDESGQAINFGAFDALLLAAPDEAGNEETAGESSPLVLLGVADSTVASLSDYFTYPGSLTTPGCTEGVRWLVTEGGAPFPATALDRLHELIAGFPGYDGYENNNRPTQPLNDRVLEHKSGG
jgi:carbonic anhydrase